MDLLKQIIELLEAVALEHDLNETEVRFILDADESGRIEHLEHPLLVPETLEDWSNLEDLQNLVINKLK